MNKDELIILSHKILEVEQDCLKTINLISLYEIETLEIEQKEKESIMSDTTYSNDTKRKIELNNRLKSNIEYNRKIKTISDMKFNIEKNKNIVSNYKRIINIEVAFKNG
jgi:hypothetical protein